MREKINFDKWWLFHRGDIETKYSPYKGFSYISAKTERFHAGPASKNYFFEPDSFDSNVVHTGEKWRVVHLRHDYIIEGLPKEENNNALGFFQLRYSIMENFFGRLKVEMYYGQKFESPR